MIHDCYICPQSWSGWRLVLPTQHTFGYVRLGRVTLVFDWPWKGRS